MTYTVTCWDLPQPVDGFHTFNPPNGFPTEVSNQGLSARLGQIPSRTVCLPCGEEGAFPPQKCALVDVRYNITPTASPSAAHTLTSQTFAPDLIQSILAQFSNRLCSLVVSLPHEDLERLGDLLPAPDVLRSFHPTPIAAVAPLPPQLALHIVPLRTLWLRNALPTWKLSNALSALTTISLIGDSQSPAPFDCEYKISDFFEFLLCAPQLRHLLLSGLGPTLYDVMSGWVVPLEFLETLCLHHCRLQAEILRHLSISLDTRVISIHTRARLAPLNAGAVFHVTASRWEFIPFCVDFYQEGENSCRLLFVGNRLRKGGRGNPVELPVLTLEILVTDAAQITDTTLPSKCIWSFRLISTANIRELTIHSYRCPRGQTKDPVGNLLRSLLALRKLVLKGCDERPFYKVLSRIRVEGRRGMRGLYAVCPDLTEVEIDPIVEFQRYLGGPIPPCQTLVTDLSKLIQERELRRAPLKRLKIVFPAQCWKEAQYVREKLFADFGMRVVRVRVARVGV